MVASPLGDALKKSWIVTRDECRAAMLDSTGLKNHRATAQVL
jgi:hypothetical protein